MKTYVINLEKSIDKFNKQKPKLEAVGLEIYRFNAINAIENEQCNQLQLQPIYW